jgi:putative transposase
VDFGVACSAYVSDETAPRLMARSLTSGEKARRLGLERRKARQLTWAKKHNGGKYSRRLRRTITGLAKLSGRQARRRQDFTHKLTTGLAKNHGWVGVEDLKVANMTAAAKGTVGKPGKNVRQKSGLNRAVLDNAPYERVRQLRYKTPRFGSELRLIPPAFTSQDCPACGRGTRTRGRAAAGSSPAPHAGTRTTRITTRRSTSRTGPAGQAAPTARAGA